MIIDKIIDNQLKNLTNVKRYSGQILLKDETDSDHVWEMESMALVLVPDLNKYLDDDEKIDIKDVIYRIVVHDLDECLSFDIPRPFKYHDKTITKAIRDTNNSIMEDNFSEDLIKDINSAKDDTREGYLVRILDSMQAGVKMRFESKIGNQFMKSQITNLIELFYEYYYEIDGYRVKFGGSYIEYMKNLITQFLREMELLVK